jgi:hypothetical protein
MKLVTCLGVQSMKLMEGVENITTIKFRLLVKSYPSYGTRAMG